MDMEGETWLVFDVDGVLVDVSESYDLAVQRTFDHFVSGEMELPLELIRKIRKKGLFGDDFSLTQAFLASANGGGLDNLASSFPEAEGIEWVEERWTSPVSREEIVRVFNTFYLGDHYGDRLFDFPGLWKRETPLVDVDLLREAERRFSIGVVTGRDKKELRLAEKIIGFEFGNAVTRETALKPDPEALYALVEDKAGTYIGDTRSDEKLVENYRQSSPTFQFLMVGRDVPNVNAAIKRFLRYAN